MVVQCRTFLLTSFVFTLAGSLCISASKSQYTLQHSASKNKYTPQDGKHNPPGA
jgi:hypothetical protein